MKEGLEITEEIEQIAMGYDFYSHYIDNYGQMMEAREKNIKIMDKLKELGVNKLIN